MPSLTHHFRRTLRRALWLTTTIVLLATHASHVNAIAAKIPADLDQSFAGGAGSIASLVIGTGAHDHLTAMALQPDGKRVLIRNCCVNGRTDDGLLLTRIALGMSGSAVLVGAISQTATRDTWPKVRDSLVNQCGMLVAP